MTGGLALAGGGSPVTTGGLLAPTTLIEGLQYRFNSSAILAAAFADGGGLWFNSVPSGPVLPFASVRLLDEVPDWNSEGDCLETVQAQFSLFQADGAELEALVKKVQNRFDWPTAQNGPGGYDFNIAGTLTRDADRLKTSYAEVELGTEDGATVQMATILYAFQILRYPAFDVD